MIRILSEVILDASHWIYKRVTYETDVSGEMQRVSREIFDRGDAAAILLYNLARGSIILTRQFRLPAFLNGGETELIEACAGRIDDGDPYATALRELREETGFVIGGAQRIFECYMSPGSVTEKITFFIAPYEPGDRKEQGGGMADEGESVETIELPFTDALDQVASGEIRDAKTILLLQYAQIHKLFG
ncbi:MAG: GDP-mannose pyrophosphatase [Hyphomicrobiales bacterium]|jgi:nudix-type nucleoside diphosphatase (YffH/AdpP family)|nr:GDP-mannose pyrophosphatase [Hyphomicrobiales bacterium]